MKKSYTVKLEGIEWKDCLKEAYKKKKKDVRIDGFRKGQVPYDVYVKKVGEEALYMDADPDKDDYLVSFYAKLVTPFIDGVEEKILQFSQILKY